MPVRLIRPVLVLALCSSVAAAGVADAATRPKPKPLPTSCHLVTDPAGNANNPDDLFPTASPLPSDDTLDIVSADIASNAKKLTTVIRVKKAATSDADFPTGIQWRFNWSAGGVQLFTLVKSDPVAGIKAAYGDTTATGNHILGYSSNVTVDPVKNEIRTTIALSDVGSVVNLVPAMRFDTFSASSSGILSLDSPSPVTGSLNLATMNTATATTHYFSGAPSCVVVGT